MWLVIVIVLGLGLGVFALIGLVAVAKELFRENSIDANVTDSGSEPVRRDLGCDHRRRREMTP